MSTVDGRKVTEEQHLLNLARLDLLQQALPPDDPCVKNKQIECFLETVALGHLTPDDLREMTS